MALAVGGRGAPLQIGDIHEELVSVDINGKPPVAGFQTVAGRLVVQGLKLSVVWIGTELFERIPDEALVFGSKAPKLFFDALVHAERPGHE